MPAAVDVKRILWHLTPPVVFLASRKLRDVRERAHARKEMARHTKLHLACGPNLLQGWANVDLAGPGAVIRWNLSRPLPVASGTIEFVYSEHFIEHLDVGTGAQLLRECHRVLKPGGVLRVSTPDVRKLVEQYVSGRLSEWRDVGWSPPTPCRMMNEGMRGWGHQFLYDADELERMFEKCGFSDITRVQWRESRHPELQGLECRPFHGEIILEGIK